MGREAELNRMGLHHSANLPVILGTVLSYFAQVKRSEGWVGVVAHLYLYNIT